jgi:HK97 gp10 family phage protein
MTIEGGPALQSKMQRLAITTQRKLIRQAARAGGKPVLAAAKANARSLHTGEYPGNMAETIAKSLQLRAGRKPKPGSYFVKVQHNPKHDDKLVHHSQGSAGGRRTFIPTAIEYGHVAPDGSHVPPKPYIRPALEQNSVAARAAMSADLIRGIEREWNSGR